MSEYARVYSDFTIVDGTHNTTVYDLKLMPFTNVDCLGKNVVSGIMLDESENSASVEKALKLFHLAVSGATLMTDGGSAYPAPASGCNMNHILCIHHFQQDVVASCAGLGHRADDFKRDAMALLYESFSTEAAFNDHFQSCEHAYASFPSAASSLRKIANERNKVCRTFTGT